MGKMSYKRYHSSNCLYLKNPRLDRWEEMVRSSGQDPRRSTRLRSHEAGYSQEKDRCVDPTQPAQVTTELGQCQHYYSRPPYCPSQLHGLLQ